MSDSNKQIIMNMYQGEENRDASSKVCGFLFQDLIAVDNLLGVDTDYVCLEYVEDVFASLKNKDTVYIIQVKYYPSRRSSVNFSEVIRDLYYQYLRLHLYGYEGNVIPVLAAHCNQKFSKPTLSDMQGEDYINIKCETEPVYPSDIDDWLCKNVYPLSKKDAENKCFKTFAWDGSINDFLNALTIDTDYKSIKEYRNDVAFKLNAIHFPGCPITDDTMKKNILLGLAIQFLQETYSKTPAGMDVFIFRKRSYDELFSYLSKQICTETDASIGAYLRTVVIDCWDNIEESNEKLTQEQIDMLQCIRDCTADWLYLLGNTPQGQLQLLNTVSMKSSRSFASFCEMGVVDRFKKICEHYDAIDTFLRYLWKIMLDINHDLLGKYLLNQPLSDEEKARLSPKFYVDDNEIHYIDVKFPDDMCDSAAILSTPNNSHKGEDLTRTFERLESFRPQKWYMSGDNKGRFSYDQNVAEIRNNSTVSQIETNQFRIECMQCVKVDMDCWQQIEDCKETIFRDDCINCKEEY